jgi:hypothetical protein
MGQLRPELKQTAKLWREFLYSRIMNIFEYENVPEEIDLQSLKLFLFFRGKIVFYKIGDEYLIQPFDYTDKLNKYYIPTNGRVVNPWLPIGHQNWEFTVEDEAIIYNSTPDVRKFAFHSIVSDLIWKTANQLAENDISYYCIQRNHRLVAIFTAESDKQKAECNRVLDRLYEGYPDITMEEDLVSHIKVNPITMNSTRSSITELIEFQQYVLANFYHSFGINSNYNLKREQLNSNEIDVNKEVLRLNIDDMLKCREEGVSKVNAKYGLDIRVHLNEEVYKALLQVELGLVQGQAPEDISQIGDTEVENSYDEKSSGSGAGNVSEEKSQNETNTDIQAGKSSDESEVETKEEDSSENESNKQTDETIRDTDEQVHEDTITIPVPENGDITVNIEMSQTETNSEEKPKDNPKSEDGEEKESDEDDNKTEDTE